jgi:two-component system, response regulator / RNA-binding antiterminator
MWHSDCIKHFMPAKKKTSSQTALRILLVDDDPERADDLRQALVKNGYDVVSQLSNPLALYDAMRIWTPDVVIVDTDSPSRDALEHIALISRDAPKPIVMFSQDGSNDTIRDAVRAGVSAYVVDGMTSKRLQPILQVAIARFAAEQTLKAELAETKVALSERKLVDRAKGLIMKHESVDEEAAFRLLRKFAMDMGIRMGEASQRMIDILSIVG